MRRSLSPVLQQPRQITAVLAATVIMIIAVTVGASPAAAAYRDAAGHMKPAGWSAMPYRATDLGFAADVLTINDRGQIAGSGNRMAYLWHLGRLTPMQVPDGFAFFSVAEINEPGTVVGTLWDPSDGRARAATWHRGKFTVIPAIGRDYGRDYAVGISINDWGTVFGTGESTSPDQSFLWHRGTLTALWHNNAYSSQTGINNWGDIVGQYEPRPGYPCHCRGALWHRGVLTDLGDLGGGVVFINQPYDVNNRREVVGWALAGDGYGNAYHWRDGVITDLGTLGGLGSSAIAINDRGQVIGHAGTATGARHPFLWDRGTMIDLTTLGLRPTDRVLDINSWGHIVGIRDGRATLFTR